MAPFHGQFPWHFIEVLIPSLKECAAITEVNDSTSMVNFQSIGETKWHTMGVGGDRHGLPAIGTDHKETEIRICDVELSGLLIEL